MRNGENADVDHGSTQRRLDDTIAHADNEQEEEGKRIPSSVKNGNKDHEYLCTNVQAMAVLKIWILLDELTRKTARLTYHRSPMSLTVQESKTQEWP